MAKDEGDDLLPDKDAAKGFYAKYEPKEILGKLVFIFKNINYLRYINTLTLSPDILIFFLRYSFLRFISTISTPSSSSIIILYYII